jgi:hypothetical protein
MDSNQVQILIYILLAAGLFLLFAPAQYQAYLPVTMSNSTRQIVGCVCILAAYYYYNGEKLF